jgi:hypothetical protein
MKIWKNKLEIIFDYFTLSIIKKEEETNYEKIN